MKNINFFKFSYVLKIEESHENTWIEWNFFSQNDLFNLHIFIKNLIFLI